MPLLTQAAYARRVGVTRQAIGRAVGAGIIPTHGAKKLIDPAEADQCYIPRIDAGAPQIRAGDPAAEAAVAAAAWRVWAAEAAARLARALGVDERQTRALLAADLEAHLARVGLAA